MSVIDRKSRMRARFHRAAPHYARHSPIQQSVARELAAAILGEPPLPEAPRVLEIGCGTGHLTAALLPRLPGARWLATDIAPGMVAGCRAALGVHAGIEFAVMDGEAPATQGPFDLVCASLAAQWFDDLPAALARLADLLAPAGVLAISSLGNGTFREWRAAHAALGLRPATPEFPDAAAFRRAWPRGGRLRVWDETYVQHHTDALDFVRSLRAIGADTPAPGHRPVAPGALRRVLAELDRRPPVPASYHVLYGLLRNDY